MMNDQQLLDTIQRAYIAYYGRAADPDGLDYWAMRLRLVDGDFYQISDAFGSSEEYDNRHEEYMVWFDSNANSELIHSIYINAFNRSADEVGLSYYLDLLETGKASLATIAQHIVDGALDGDLLTVNNKIKAANIFSDAIDEAGIAFLGGHAQDQATSFISSVKSVASDWDYYVEKAETIASQYMVDHNNYQDKELASGYQLRYQQDTNGDGYLDKVTITTYDDQGREVQEDTLWGGNQNHPNTLEKKYDEEGRLIREEFDGYNSYYNDYYIEYEYDLAGALSSQFKLTYRNTGIGDVSTQLTQYNSRGQVTLLERGSGGDTPVNSVWEYRYDSEGNLLYEKYASPEYEQDYYEYSYEYDEFGRLIREERDDNADGTIEYLALYEYDSEGNMTLEFIDHIASSYYSPIEVVPLGVSGVAANESLSLVGNESSVSTQGNYNIWPYEPINLSSNTSWDYSYDDNGNILQKVTDLEADGSIDEILSYEYNDQDQITYFAEDSNGDGQNDYIVSYGYDAQGNQIRHEEDLDGDGVVDSIELAYFEYNSQGDITYQSGDLNGDGVAEWAYEWSYDYDQSGNLLEVEFGIVGNNSGGYILRYGFDDQGNKIMEQKENTGVFLDDASAGAYSYYWEYSDSGDLIRQEQDLDSDGELEYALYHAYNSDNELILVSTSGVFEQPNRDYYVILAGIADSQADISI